MARKVFISVLGTGFYKPCIYGDTGTPTRFIQEATLLSIGVKEWSSDDTGIVLLTDKARTSNWEVADNKRKDPKTNVAEEYCGLKQRIEGLQLPFNVQEKDIPDGKNEVEMWTIFTTLFDALQDGDELYIDLTHAFRYLPMLVLVLTNYAKFILNGVTIKSVTYGNWEAREEEGNDKAPKAPIVDLMPIVALQDWTHAAADYLNNGYAKGLKEMTENTLHPLMKDEATRNRDLAFIRSFSAAIEKISNERIMCRGMDIVEGKNVGSLVRAANQIEEVTVAPLKPVIDKIIASVNTADSDSDIKRCIDAAQWCCDKHLYQQAITILQEGIVTFICERHGIDVDDKDMRGLVNIAFDRMINDSALSKFAQEHISKIEAIQADEYFLNKELILLFSSITTLRNDYNHCGFRPKEQRQKVKTMTDNIKEFINTAARIFLPNN